jgi:L-asparaginase type II
MAPEAGRWLPFRRLPAVVVAVLLGVVVADALPLGAQEPAAGAEREGRPRVVVVTTGGTIASAPGGTVAGDSLVAAVPELADHAEVTVDELYRIGSSRMTPDRWLELARHVDALLAADPGLAGVVVTHGTDTLEETAFFLELTLRGRRPVVLVGSMRPPGALSADGPANLVAAVRVAVAPDAVGRGVLVVLNDEIAAARDVEKLHNQRVDAFRTDDLGLLGWVDPDTVLFRRAPLRPDGTGRPFALDRLGRLPEVIPVADYTGSDGSVLRALASRPAGARPDGVVVATFAGGRMSPGTREGVQAAVEAGVQVVLASRVPGGRIVGDPAAELGAVVAPDLPPHKARILLMLALDVTRDRDELQRLFHRF